MKLTIKGYDVDSSEQIVLIHEADCAEIGVQEGDRVNIPGPRPTIVLVSHTDTLIDRGVVAMSNSLLSKCGLKEGDVINVTYAAKPDSVRSIRKKMDGEALTREEIRAIVEDILENRLSKIEISAWLTSLYINGMDIAGAMGGHGGGNTCGLAGAEANGHDAGAALDGAVGGDAATGDENVAQALRGEAAVGDAVAFALSVTEGSTLDILARGAAAVNVEIVAVPANLVGKRGAR